MFRVSESCKSAVSQESGGGGQTFYATGDLIGVAENKLLAASSAISLKETGETIESSS